MGGDDGRTGVWGKVHRDRSIGIVVSGTSTISFNPGTLTATCCSNQSLITGSIDIMYDIHTFGVPSGVCGSGRWGVKLPPFSLFPNSYSAIGSKRKYLLVLI